MYAEALSATRQARRVAGGEGGGETADAGDVRGACRKLWAPAHETAGCAPNAVATCAEGGARVTRGQAASTLALEQWRIGGGPSKAAGKKLRADGELRSGKACRKSEGTCWWQQMRANGGGTDPGPFVVGCTSVQEPQRRRGLGKRSELGRRGTGAKSEAQNQSRVRISIEGPATIQAEEGERLGKRATLTGGAEAAVACASTEESPPRRPRMEHCKGNKSCTRSGNGRPAGATHTTLTARICRRRHHHHRLPPQPKSSIRPPPPPPRSPPPPPPPPPRSE